MQGFRRIFAILATGICGGAIAAADEPAVVVTSVRESLNEARGHINRGRPDLAIRLLRRAQAQLRAGEQGPAAVAWDRKLQGALIEAVRAEERIEAADEQARREERRREAVAGLPGAVGREDALHREHDRIMAQVGGIGGGGIAGGGGVVGGVGGGGFAVGGGAIGFAPSVGFIGVGPTLGVAPVVSADRRYVRLGMNPIFLSNLSFARFPVFGAVGGS